MLVSVLLQGPAVLLCSCSALCALSHAVAHQKVITVVNSTTPLPSLLPASHAGHEDSE